MNNKISKPLYSLCICNYNMGDTLENSINSLLYQINQKTEILVIDDGSNDDSLKILKKLKNENPYNFRFIPLLRDSRRKLGETRNISIRAARGKYVILHLDTDDIWDPHINTFLKIYHEIEKRLSLQDFLLSGKQIQMATRDLILNTPYENVYYGEDRLLWSKLTTLGKLITLEHKVFRKRIPIKSTKKRLLKIITSQFSSIRVSFSYTPNFYRTFAEYLKRIIFKSDWSMNLSVINSIVLLPACIKGYFLDRKDLYNLATWDYRKITQIDLISLEKNTKAQHGEFNFNEEEKEIFMLKVNK